MDKYIAKAILISLGILVLAVILVWPDSLKEKAYDTYSLITINEKQIP